MAEREADRARPERLHQQAVVALVSDADREISPEFRRRLREHDRAPSFFDANELAESARSGLEIDITQNLQAGQGFDSTNAVRDARSEWNAFMSSLPKRSWVGDIVAQL